MGKKKKQSVITEETKPKHISPNYDIQYFLDMHKKMQYNPNGKDIQYPGRRKKK